MRTTVLIALITLVFASQVDARDIYVDNVAGDDLWRGLHAAGTIGGDGPVRSIGRALAMAQSRDRIVLANTGQPYRESVSLAAGDHSGAPNDLFVLEGNGATLDGTAPVPLSAWEYAGIKDVFRFQPPRMAHQQIYLAGRPLVRVAADRAAETPPALKPLEWCLWRGHVYFRIEAGRWINDYPLSHTLLPVGISLYHVRNVAIANLTVQGFQLDGVNAHDAHNCTLYGIVARGNGRSGIAVTASSRATIEACLVGDNGEAQVLTEGYSKTVIRDSELLENTAPPVVRRGGEVIVAERTEAAAESDRDQPAAEPQTLEAAPGAKPAESTPANPFAP